MSTQAAAGPRPSWPHTLTVLLPLCYQLHVLAQWQPQQELHGLLPRQVPERHVIHLPGGGHEMGHSPRRRMAGTRRGAALAGARGSEQGGD